MIAPSVSSRKGMVAKNPKRVGYFLQMFAANVLWFRAMARFSPLILPDDEGGRDRMAMSIPYASINFKLISGVQGRFSGGVRHPTCRFFFFLSRLDGKKWWCMSIRRCILCGDQKSLKVLWLNYCPLGTSLFDTSLRTKHR
jgi:hypothetical protein